MSNYSAYTTAGPTGEVGPIGPTGPIGPIGPTGPEVTGIVGSTGIGISFADGTADTSLYVELQDGSTFQYSDVSLPGNALVSGIIQYEDLGDGISFVHGVCGDHINFRSLKFSNDYTVTGYDRDLLVSVHTTSGTASVNAGLENQLVFMSGTTLASGATFTFYGTGGGIAEKEFISATFRDITNIVKGASGQFVEDPNGNYTEIPNTRTSLHDANIVFIDQQNMNVGNSYKVLYSGPTFTSPHMGSTYGIGKYSNVLFSTFVINVPDNEFDRNITFADIDSTQFDYNLLSVGSYNILNCISVNNGVTWDCFLPNTGFTHEYADIHKPGSCCIDDECYDYMNFKGCAELGGVFEAGTICDDAVCFETEIMGACCTNDICLETTQTECNRFSGKWFQEQLCEFVPCQPVCSEIENGACCFQFGQCDDRLTKEYCEFYNGTYMGDGIHCFEVDCCEETTAKGACCVGGVCSFLSAQDCYTSQGIFYGSDVSCQDVDCCDIQSTSGMCCCQEGGLAACIDNVSSSYCDVGGCVWVEGGYCAIDCDGFCENCDDCQLRTVVVDFEAFSASVLFDNSWKTYLPSMNISNTEEFPYPITGTNFERIKIVGAKFIDVDYVSSGIPLSDIEIKLEAKKSSGGDVEVMLYSTDNQWDILPLDHELSFLNVFADWESNNEITLTVYNKNLDSTSTEIGGVFNGGHILLFLECSLADDLCECIIDVPQHELEGEEVLPECVLMSAGDCVNTHGGNPICPYDDGYNTCLPW